MTNATPNHGGDGSERGAPDSPADDEQIGLSGPDTGGYAHGQIMQWAMLHPDIKASSFRFYSIVRSLIINDGRDLVRYLSKDEMRQLVPGPGGKPLGKSTLDDILRELETAEMLTYDQAARVTTEHDPDTGRFVERSRPRWRLHDLPDDQAAYEGWRNVHDKLAAIQRGEDVTTGPGPRDRKSGDGDDQHKPELSTGSSPRPDRGRKSGHAGRKSGRGGRKSGRAEATTSQNPPLEEVLEEELENPPTGADGRAPAREESSGEQSVGPGNEGGKDTPSGEEKRSKDEPEASASGPGTSADDGDDGEGALVAEGRALFAELDTSRKTSRAQAEELLHQYVATRRCGHSAASVRARLTSPGPSGGTWSNVGLWRSRLVTLQDQSPSEAPETGPRSTESNADGPAAPDAPCGSCDARYALSAIVPDPISSRVVYTDDGPARGEWCPRCHPKGMAKVARETAEARQDAADAATGERGAA